VKVVPALIWQFGTFGLMILTGLALGVLFDVYRVVRSFFKQGSLSAMLMDLFFWLLATPATFVMLLIGNWGELRLYVFIGIALGLFAYFQLASPLVLWALVTWVRWIGRLTAEVLYNVIRILGVPFRIGRMMSNCRVNWHRLPTPPDTFFAPPHSPSSVSSSPLPSPISSPASTVSGPYYAFRFPLISTRAGFFFRRPPWSNLTWRSILDRWRRG
jgi:spore cortex biosynthesis protein YabQ